jgi:hypothetical protein
MLRIYSHPVSGLTYLSGLLVVDGKQTDQKLLSDGNCFIASGKDDTIRIICSKSPITDKMPGFFTSNVINVETAVDGSNEVMYTTRFHKEGIKEAEGTLNSWFSNAEKI